MISELSELNERRRGSNKVRIEEDKWKELSRKSSEELEQGTYMYMYEHYNAAARLNIQENYYCEIIIVRVWGTNVLTFMDNPCP